MKWAALFLFVSLALSASAATQPKDVGSSQVFIELNWTLGFGDNLPPKFTLTAFGFPDNAWQKARFESGAGREFVEKSDEFGNPVVEYSFTPQNPVEELSLRAFVDANYLALPQAGEPGSYAEFTPLTQASPEIRAQALRIMTQTNDTLERASLVSEWVNNRVNYDGLGYGLTVENASWVYENRLGTCDEYSHLMASMLRVADIPVKFVAGFVCSTNCSQSENWGPHAWVEVYADGYWYPFDPTFNEGIVLDATHVKFAEGRDQNDIKERLSATAYNYPLEDVTFERSTQISLDSQKPFPQLASININATNQPVGEGAVEKVSVTVKNRLDRSIAVPVSLTAPREISVLTQQNALLYLPPHGTRFYSWTILFPQTFEEGYIYKFPIRIDSLGQNSSITITGKKGGLAETVANLTVTDSYTYLDGEVLYLKITLKNLGNQPLKDVPISFDTDYGTTRASLTLEPAESVETTLRIPLNATSGQEINGRLTIDSYPKITQEYVITLPPQPTASVPTDLETLSFSPEPALAIAIVIILILALYLYRKT